MIVRSDAGYRIVAASFPFPRFVFFDIQVFRFFDRIGFNSEVGSPDSFNLIIQSRGRFDSSSSGKDNQFPNFFTLGAFTSAGFIQRWWIANLGATFAQASLAVPRTGKSFCRNSSSPPFNTHSVEARAIQTSIPSFRSIARAETGCNTFASMSVNPS